MENNRHQQELYERELSEEGYIVWIVADASEALDLLRQRHADLVVLDPGIHWLHGADTVELLNCGVPVLVYTACSHGDARFASQVLQSHGYLLKSSNLNLLQREIARVLDKNCDPGIMGG